MHVKLYEDIARHGHIATTYAYPVLVAGRYIMGPSPIPKFDNPKLDDCPALQLFGAGREKRIYAVPPYTRVVTSTSRTIRSSATKFDAPARFAAPTARSSTKSSPTMRAAGCSSARTPTIARSAGSEEGGGGVSPDRVIPANQESRATRVSCWPGRSSGGPARGRPGVGQLRGVLIPRCG